MSDISIRKAGRAGRITLTRPKALNALSHDMALQIDAALKEWATDDAVACVIFDAEGDKAFCAGGDIADLYHAGKAGNFDHARDFWRDEYRMNGRIRAYPKPVVSFMQGFTMGGGVGIGCHAAHRVVDDSTRMAMPECGIGLVPDVGGTYLLACAPGQLGAWLGLTGHRMDAPQAIAAGFADHLIARENWGTLIAGLEADGDTDALAAAAQSVADPFADTRPEIDQLFAHDSVEAIRAALAASDSDLAGSALKAMNRSSPISMAGTLAILRRLQSDGPTMQDALTQEYRFTWRSMQQGDFLEGIRAQIIDKDRTPTWRHAQGEVTDQDIAAMLAPLGADELTFDA